MSKKSGKLKNKNCLYCDRLFKPKNINQKLCSNCLKMEIYYCCDECGQKFLLNKNQKRDYLMGVDRKYYCSNHCVRKNQKYECKCVNCNSNFLSSSNTSLLCPDCRNIIVIVNCSFCNTEIELSKKWSNYELTHPGIKNYFCNKSCSSKFLFKMKPNLRQEARQRIINYNKSELGRLNSSKVGKQTGSNNIKKAHNNDGYRFCNECGFYTFHLIGIGCLSCHNKKQNFKSYCINCKKETTHVNGLGCMICFNKKHNYKDFCSDCNSYTIHVDGLGCLSCFNSELKQGGSWGVKTKLIFPDKEIITRSRWETIFALFLFYNNFNFSYESLKINYVDFDNRKRTYWPDFIIDDEVVEIKGWVTEDVIKLLPIYEKEVNKLGFKYSFITNIDYFKEWLIINGYKDILNYILKESKLAKENNSIFEYKF